MPLTVSHHRVSSWSVKKSVVVGSGVVGVPTAPLLVSLELGKPEFQSQQFCSELSEGAFFSVSLSARVPPIDIDKAMLARIATTRGDASVCRGLPG